MKVSVVIPVYNEEKYIQNCLEHIFKQIEKPDEVIVVDNNCTDNTIQIARKYQVRIIKEDQQGMIQARDKGFNTAKYSVIARTDADTEVPEDWIKKIKMHFKDKSLMALSGPSYFSNIPDVFQVSDWPTVVFFKSFRKISGHQCLYGPNMAIRRSAWLLVKDETCKRDNEVHEDIDLALHIAKYGEIKFDNALVVTSSPRRWKKFKPYLEYPYRYIKTIVKHHESIMAANGNGIVKKVVPTSKRIIRALSDLPTKKL